MIRDLPTTTDGRLIGQGRRFWRELVRGASSAGAVLARWHELARERRQLAALDERALKDLGLTRAEAEREAGRPFWDAHGVAWRGWR